MRPPLRLLLVHRWAGDPDKDWYPWFRQQCGRYPKLFGEVQCLEMPGDGDSLPPEPGEWTRRLLAAMGSDAPLLRRTLLVGHSVGAQACFRAAAAAPHHLAGILAVAPWFAVDRPWKEVGPWMEGFPSYERLHAKCRRVVCLVSDNDPFTKDYERTKRECEERTGALVFVVPGARHFGGGEEGEVWRRAVQMARIIVEEPEAPARAAGTGTREAADGKQEGLERPKPEERDGRDGEGEDGEHEDAARPGSISSIKRSLGSFRRLFGKKGEGTDV
ncbi:Alpha/Beta hydrolase protein [Hyaloraphidium curvatum]|nr:Alpha/Beta hydrolase protein [Hyaloraphidium curvatum]